MADNVMIVLAKWSDYMIEMARRRLVQGRKSATGALIRSLSYRIKKTNGVYEMQLTGLPYLLNVDRGRRAGARRPPINKIEAWIKVKRIKINIPKGSTIQKETKKRAFMIANNISKRGIPPFPILDIATKIQSRPGFKKELQEAVRLDIVKQLNMIFK
jgi:hypothetical protein